jgi:hypothetical protein
MVTNTFENFHVANDKVWHAPKRPKGFGFGEARGELFFASLFQKEGEHAIDYFNDFT